VFKDKALQAEKDPESFPDVTISDFTGDSAPLIKKYKCEGSKSGYNWTIIINDEDEAKYEEDYEFPTFENIEMLPPFEGSSYQLKCAPGEW
jgi:hypothetical protein